MNLKLSLGIILPFFIIVFMIVIGSLGTLNVQKSVVASVQRSQVFSGTYSQLSINVYNETVTNDYFMPIKHTLQKFGACIENIQTSLSAFQTTDDLDPEQNYKNMYGAQAENIEIAPGETKVIRTYIRSYSGTTVNNSNVILLIPLKDNKYINCYSLTDSDKQDAYRIIIS